MVVAYFSMTVTLTTGVIKYTIMQLMGKRQKFDY